MEIFSKDKRLRAILEDASKCKRHFGAPMAEKIRMRITALRAAESLATFWPPKSPVERCHELTGNRKGVFSVDVMQPYRLLFAPIEDAPPKDRSDDHEHWKQITKINLLAIEDTHGKQ